MKKLRERMAENAGFTLVELIVVIAILGILAAVAVPAYTGYITKAHEAADIVSLDAIKTAAMAAKAEEGAVTDIKVTTSATNGTVTKVEVKPGTVDAPDEFEDITNDPDFKMFMGEFPTLKSETYKDGTTWSETTSSWSK